MKTKTGRDRRAERIEGTCKGTKGEEGRHGKREEGRGRAWTEKDRTETRESKRQGAAIPSSKREREIDEER